MAQPGRRHPAGRRAMVVLLLPPLLAVGLALGVAVGLAVVLIVGGSLQAGQDPGPEVALAGGTSGPSAEDASSASPSDEAAPARTSATAGPDPRSPSAASAATTAPDDSAPDDSASDGTPAAGTVADGSVPGGTTATPGLGDDQEAARADQALRTVAEAAARAGGTVHVVVLSPDGRGQVADPGAIDPVYTASLVKLLVVQQLFAREAAGQLALTEGDLDRMARAVSASDDDAMSALWSRFDGPQLVTAAVAEFGLTGTTPPAVPGQWGEARTTAADTAVFLAALGDHLAADDLATLTGWMRSPAAIAPDGFDQRWGLLTPAVTTGTSVAAKQGWMCCIDGRRQLHSAGTLPDGRTVVLLGDFPTSTSWARAKEALDAAAVAATSGP